jgi:hypothetical protein
MHIQFGYVRAVSIKTSSAHLRTHRNSPCVLMMTWAGRRRAATIHPTNRKVTNAMHIQFGYVRAAARRPVVSTLIFFLQCRLCTFATKGLTILPVFAFGKYFKIKRSSVDDSLIISTAELLHLLKKISNKVDFKLLYLTEELFALFKKFNQLKMFSQ